MRISLARKWATSSAVCMLTLFVLIMLFAAGCGSNIMTNAKLISQPEQGKTLVTFIRPAWVGGAITFGIWDSDNLVGVLTQGSSIQYQTVPGEHYFLARAENWSCVKADLAPNRHYVIKANPFMGVWKARVALDPMTKSDYQNNKTLEQVRKWLKSLKPTMPDPIKVDAYVQPRHEQVLQGKASFQANRGKYETLARQDYLPE